MGNGSRDASMQRGIVLHFSHFSPCQSVPNGILRDFTGQSLIIGVCTRRVVRSKIIPTSCERYPRLRTLRPQMVNPNLRLSWSRWFVGYNSSGLPLQPTIREKKRKRDTRDWPVQSTLQIHEIATSANSVEFAISCRSSDALRDSKRPRIIYANNSLSFARRLKKKKRNTEISFLRK